MTDANRYYNEFEILSNDVIKEIFKGLDVCIRPTKAKKDGGYDTIVTIFHENKVKKIYFEHKLRSNNLNLRDISANTIIAFNEGAVALVIMTNKEYTAQAQDNLTKFSQKTILNVKLFVGEDIKKFCIEHQLPVNQHLTPMLEKSVTLGKKEYDLLKLNLENHDLVSQILNKVSYYYDVKKPFIVKELDNQYNELYNHICQGHSVTLKGPVGVGKNTMVTYCAQVNNFRLITIDASTYTTAKECLLGILKDMWGVTSTDSHFVLSTNQIDDICVTLKEKKEFEFGEENELYNILHYLLSKESKVSVEYEKFNYFICHYIAQGIKMHIEKKYIVYVKNIRDAFFEIKTLLNYLCDKLEEQNIACIVKEDIIEFDIQEDTLSFEKKKQIFKTRKYILEIPLLKENGADRYIKYTAPNIPQNIRKDIVRHLGCRILVLSDFLSTGESDAVIDRLKKIPAGSLPEVINYSLENALSKASSIFFALVLCNHEIPLCLTPKLIAENDFPVLEHMLSIGYIFLDENMIVSSSILIKQNISNLVSSKCRIKLYEYARQLHDEASIDYKKYPDIFANILIYSGKTEQGCTILINLAEKTKREHQYSAYISLAEKLLEFSISPLTKAELLTNILQICSIQRNINLDYVKKYFRLLSDVVDALMPDEINSYREILDYFCARNDFKNGNYTKCFEDTEGAYNIALLGSCDEWNNRIAWMHVLCIKELNGYDIALNAFEAIRMACPSDRTIEKGYLSHLACMKLALEPSDSVKIYRNMVDNWERKPQIVYELPFHEYVDVIMALTCAKRVGEAKKECIKVIPILESNGVMSELGRLYNIRGCIHIINNEPQKAKKDFQTSVALFAESPYGLYEYRAKLNLAMSFLENHDNDDCVELLEEVYLYFKEHCIGRIVTSFEHENDNRVYLALIKILRIAEKTKSQYIADELLNLPELDSKKTHILNDCHTILSDNSFIHNNEILLMG